MVWDGKSGGRGTYDAAQETGSAGVAHAAEQCVGYQGEDAAENVPA